MGRLCYANFGVRRELSALLLGNLLILMGASACDDGKPSKADVRLWGRDRLDKETQEKAKETLDPYLVGSRPEVRARVLGMSFGEVVARLGYLKYQGTAEFALRRNLHKIDIVENTEIEHGLHGSFRIKQTDSEKSLTRETVYSNGVFYVRNGKGRMRMQGIIENQHLRVREEVFEPLRVYTSYFGARCGLKKVGADNVDDRAAAKYEFVLLEGADLVTTPGMKGSKRPKSLEGFLWVDEKTAAPIKADFSGMLEIPGKEGATPGTLKVALKFSVKTTPGDEIKPGKDVIPTIERHPTDLDPLAFMRGDVRTSTVIGGKPKAKAKPKPKKKTDKVETSRPAPKKKKKRSKKKK